MSSLFFRSYNRNRQNKNRGFTLVELLVTVGIFVFMTALVIARYNNFYSATLFKNLAYDIALTIRQAQTYGVSVKVDEDVSSFNSAYGVHFESSSGNNTKFSLNKYEYNSNNNTYSISGQEKLYNLKHGATISNLAGYDVKDDYTSFVVLDSLDIIFKRPKPEPIFCGKISANGNMNCNYYSATTTIKSPLDNRSVYILTSEFGQILIDDLGD